jgi:predicted DNA-binding protein
MSQILTLRLRPGKLARIDRRAAQLGQDRSSYVRSLIEQDLKETGSSKHVFASRDLLGVFRTGVSSSDNATVRRVIRQRLLQRHEKNR